MEEGENDITWARRNGKRKKKKGKMSLRMEGKGRRNWGKKKEGEKKGK